MTAGEYRTGVADLSVDGAKILALWREGLTQNGVPEAKLEWYYRRNPQGTPQVLVLEHGSPAEAAGVGSVGPRAMHAGTRSIRAGVLVDFVVDRRHRHFFPAVKLQQELRRRAEQGHALLLAFPNRNSTPVFQRVGYRHLGDMERRVRVLRSAGYLSRYLPEWLSARIGPLLDAARLATYALQRRMLPRWRTQWLDRPDERFDRLWQRASAGAGVIGLRDRVFLTWRFSNCPVHRCRFFTAWSGDRLVAYAACAPEAPSLKVLDFLADPGWPGAVTALFLELAREAHRAGYHSLAVEFFGDAATRAALASAGLARRAVRPLFAAGPSSDELASCAGWHITCADEDW